jgi:glyoxylase-like metal-dependent hydrolase (beta-lactamase superfamily II)
MSLSRISDRVFRFADAANCYVITAGQRALLVDSGLGGVADALAEIGVDHVDWVIHTHHHRDQCLGDAALVRNGARIATPYGEAHLLENAEEFWRTRQVYDQYDGASTDNSLATDVPVHRRLRDYEVFEWADLSFEVFPTPGHTRGSVTYLVTVDGVDYAFTGDLIHSAGRVWTLHDLEWWYALAEGARVAAHSVHALRGRRPARLAPSHGEVLDDPDAPLQQLEANLAAYFSAADRGYKTELGPDRHEPSGRFVRLSEHLVAAVGTCAHFYVLISETGESLFFDYGMASELHGMSGFRFTEHSLAELKARYGVDPPAVMIATHYHDDHVCGAPFLRARFGTEVWASACFSDILERPYAYKLPCVTQTPVPVARHLPVGEEVVWNEYRLSVVHNPGHTWYASSILFEVDGRRVAAVGDEVGLNPDGKLWGNVPVWRNRVTPSDYVTSIDTLLDFDPEIVLTGHKGALNVSRELLLEFRAWATVLASACNALVPPDNAGFAFDPGFVSVDPYQLLVETDDQFLVRVRNHLPTETVATIEPIVPAGWRVTPSSRTVDVPPGATGETGFRLRAPTGPHRPDRFALPIAVRLGDRAFGHPTELLVTTA